MEDKDTELLCKVSANHLFLAQFEPFRATLRSLRVQNPELSRAILQTIVANGGRFDSIIWSQSCSSPALLTFLCTLELLQFNEPTSQLWSFDADALKLRAEFCLIIQNVISRVSESISSSELGAEAVDDVDLNGDVSGINEHLKGLGESLRVLVKICDMGLRRLRPDLIEMDDVIDNKGDSGGDIVVEDEEMMCLRRVFLENADMFDVLSLNIEKQVGWIENEDSDMAITVRTVVKHKEVEDKVLKSLQQCIQIAHLDAMRECLMNNDVDGAVSHIRFLHLNYGINEEEYRVVSKDLLRRVLLGKDDYGDAWREMRDKFLSVYEEALSSRCTPLVKMIQVVMIILAKRDDCTGISSLKQFLHAKFHTKDLGQLKYFLGVEVARSKHGIFLSQRKYVLDLLAETGKLGAKPCGTPMDPNVHLTKDDADPFDAPERYRRLVGKLNYLTVTRPDIAYAVSIVSQFMSVPTVKHWAALEQILCYLKGAPGLGILYSDHKHNRVECFADADWAGSRIDRRSTTGYCVFVGGNLVSWRSKKQNVVSRSSAESEYRAMAQSTCEILWIQHLLAEVGLNPSFPAKLWCDNQAALHIASNPVYHERTKHIEVDCHFVREKIQENVISTGYVKTGEQLGDIFTKPLNGTRMEYLCNKLGMINIYAPT